MPPDKASSKELMFNGKGELGKGGPRKMEQPPNPTEMPCQHATSRDASHSFSTTRVSFTSAASTEGNRGSVTETIVRCGSARGTKQTIRPMAESHNVHKGTGDSLKSTWSSSRNMGPLRGTEKGDCLLPRLDAGNRSPEVTGTVRRRFNFVNVGGGVLHDVTNTILGN